MTVKLTRRIKREIVTSQDKSDPVTGIKVLVIALYPDGDLVLYEKGSTDHYGIDVGKLFTVLKKNNLRILGGSGTEEVDLDS